jgi:hypothetical protein
MSLHGDNVSTLETYRKYRIRVRNSMLVVFQLRFREILHRKGTVPGSVSGFRVTRFYIRFILLRLIPLCKRHVTFVLWCMLCIVTGWYIQVTGVHYTVMKHRGTRINPILCNGL